MATDADHSIVPTITEVRHNLHDKVTPLLTILYDDLRSFHAKHFPGTLLPQEFFFSSAENEANHEDEYYDEGDDELGYYPDGVKRTLTDTQISIFRHSEIQRLLWREFGEYGGPIFPKSAKSKACAKTKLGASSAGQSTVADEQQRNRRPSAVSEQTSAAEVNSPSDTKSTPKVPGSNYTAPTAGKKKRKRNKKVNERAAARAIRSEQEHIRSQLQQGRANTSSPEPNKQVTKKAKPLKKEVTPTDERHNPDDFKSEGEDFTYRRIARDEDDVPNLAVDLDY